MVIDTSFESERAKLEKSGKLHNAHYAVVAFSFILTVGVWQFASYQVNARIAQSFDRSSEQIIDLVTERMERYEEALWAGVALIEASGYETDFPHWRAFANSLQLETRYPGVNGVGVIFQVPEAELDTFIAEQRRLRPDFRVHPEVDTDLHMPITLIEPQDINQQAVGLDVAFETSRLTGLLAARDSAETRITAPIQLVQDSGSTPGFLFYAPVYFGGIPTGIEARKDRFLGAVYAPFIVRQLMAGTLEKDRRDLRITIRDADSVIYDENIQDEPTFDPDPMFERRIDLEIYGRNWSFDLRSNLDFRANNFRSQPLVILVCGIIIDILLLALFFLLTTSNRRAVAFADQLNAALLREKKELQSSNAALEEYAYVSSHDLQTPLRSMSDVIEYLEEDLEEAYPGATKDPRVTQNLTDLRQLLDRMTNLVRGVLEFARIGRAQDIPEPLEPRDKIERLARELGLGSGQVTLTGDFPRINFNPLRFTQITGNLLGNARKHHGDPEFVKINVTGEVEGNTFVMSISDNGPGIDERYHDKIFEMFQSLDQTKAGEGSGIGLAVVRRAVEAVGGTITLTSSKGAGATFTICLPDTVIESSDSRELAA